MNPAHRDIPKQVAAGPNLQSSTYSPVIPLQMIPFQYFGNPVFLPSSNSLDLFEG